MKRVLALLDELRHRADAFLDRNMRIHTRHAEDIERLNPEIAQTVLAGAPQIARIAAATHPIRAALFRAAALRMDDDIAATATDRRANESMVVTLAIAGRRIEKIDTAIQRQMDGGGRFRIVGGTVDAGHAVASQAKDRHHEVGVAE